MSNCTCIDCTPDPDPLTELDALRAENEKLRRLLVDQVRHRPFKTIRTKANQFIEQTRGCFTRRLGWDGTDADLVRVLIAAREEL